MSIDIDSLNGPQREAVVTVDGPLLVLAGAGSGKTRVLTYRIANLIENHDVAPWEILAITFTNKAAAEMRERLNGLVGPRCRGMWVSTFHSMCVRMLRSDAEKLGFTRNFTIYDTDDQKRLYKEIMAELDIDPKRFPVNALMNRISTAKNELVVPSAFEEGSGRPGGKVASRVYSALQGAPQSRERLRLRRPSAIRLPAAEEPRRRAVGLPAALPLHHGGRVPGHEPRPVLHHGAFGRGHKNIMVVGDGRPNPSTRGAAPTCATCEFEQDYPTAHTVKLEQNYRSVGNVLAAANAVIANNQHRKAKKLFTSAEDGDKIQVYMAADERDEGRWIAGEIEKQRAAGLSYNQVAVFYRTNAQSRMLEDMLLRAGVPYRIVGGTRFFDRAEIRDVMAYLTLVVNPADDIAAKRVINVPRRGIGKTTIERIEQFAREMGMTFMEGAELAIVDPELRASARQAIGEFVASSTRRAPTAAICARSSRRSSTRAASSARCRPRTPTRRAAASRTSRSSSASSTSSPKPTRTRTRCTKRPRRAGRSSRTRGRPGVLCAGGRAGRVVLRLRGRERAREGVRGLARARPARRLAGRLHRVGAPAHRPRR